LNSIQILYEDNHFIAVNKTNNDLVQGDQTGDISLDKKVKAYLKEKYNKPGNVYLGVVHRLDRPVSGVVLFAKTSKALSRINKLFKNKEIEKTYWALVQKKPNPPSGELNHFMVRDRRKNKSFAFTEPREESKRASLTYRLKARSDRYYLLEVDLHTGRHHQIRSQLSKIGCPIKGDLKYGYPRSNKGGGISLHARSMKFIHPVKNNEVEIKAIPPDEKLWNFFYAKLKKM
jgi:23S rRNA pseudouridine1911/1915/1917 synthase